MYKLKVNHHCQKTAYNPIHSYRDNCQLQEEYVVHVLLPQQHHQSQNHGLTSVLLPKEVLRNIPLCSPTIYYFS